jgi:hypothetical protein
MKTANARPRLQLRLQLRLRIPVQRMLKSRQKKLVWTPQPMLKSGKQKLMKLLLRRNQWQLRPTKLLNPRQIVHQQLSWPKTNQAKRLKALKAPKPDQEQEKQHGTSIPTQKILPLHG